ncbi:MAG TPA: TolC family protein, partial [Pseudomonadales bacterium]|nr:TolC family protein [Pseudomonadales bacterium]
MNQTMKTALLALLLLAGHAGADTPPASSISYETLLALLGASHPEFRAMQAEADAAHEAIDAAAALPDPELKLELMDIHDADLRPDEVGTTRYTIEQRLPLWGKRRLRREAATSAHAAASARAAQSLAELRAQLRIAFSEYYAASAELAINEATRTLFVQALRSASERQANSLAPQQDL